MKKTSGIGKTLRTSIGDLQAGELSEEELARVAGGATSIGWGGGWTGGGGLHEAGNKCWQASTSVTNPGTPDTAQDYVND